MPPQFWCGFVFWVWFVWLFFFKERGIQKSAEWVTSDMTSSSNLLLNFSFLKHCHFPNFCNLSSFLQQVTRKHLLHDQYVATSHLLTCISFLVWGKCVHKGIKLWGILAQPVIRLVINLSCRGGCLSCGHGLDTTPIVCQGWCILSPNYVVLM